MKEVPLISVIVPIYNVERYLRRCLDSLKGQSLKQIEIICIDDGSTDESGSIADEYLSNEWPVYHVIHTENRGLSAARNLGIDKAQAEWIMFVDSDDWVDERFCEIPYRTAIENQADLVVFGHCNITRINNRKIARAPVQKAVVDELTAFKYGGVVAWAKTYRRELFKEIRYPEGRVYEDIATTHKLIHIAERIVLIHDCLYYHVNRKNSISNTRSLRNERDHFVAVLERYDTLIMFDYPKEIVLPLLHSAAIRFLVSPVPICDALYIKAKAIVNTIERMPIYLSNKAKLAYLIYKHNNRLFDCFRNVIGKTQNR